MSRPLVTVIMAAWNAERFICEAIESVIAQSVEDWELLIIDDGSTDGTPEIIADYTGRDGRISVVSSTRNQGLARARNAGLRRARGDLIAFIDSDDVWHPEKTALQVASMQQYQADISYTGYERRRDGKQRGIIVAVPERVSYRTMLGRNLIPASSSMVRRSSCGAARMVHVEGVEDHLYWLALLRDGSRNAVGVTKPLVRYRVHPGGLSASKLRQASCVWKRLREVQRFGLGRSLWYFMAYACGSLKIRCTRRPR